MQIISAKQIEQFWCLDNYKLFVSTETQLADPLFSSYSAPERSVQLEAVYLEALLHIDIPHDFLNASCYQTHAMYYKNL